MSLKNTKYLYFISHEILLNFTLASNHTNKKAKAKNNLLSNSSIHW